MPFVGFLVNPLAGIGGRLALKGSDDTLAVARALALGVEPVAPARARRALAVLRRTAPDVRVIAAPGEMGGDLASDAGLATTVLELRLRSPTSAADTSSAAAELARRGVDLLLFAGGDGTARDVAGAVGTAVPLLGIPAGVKMRSGVFATGPEASGEAAGRYLLNRGLYPVIDAEVVDASEGEAGLGSRLHGIARVPAIGGRLQSAKTAAPRADAAALGSLCRSIAAEMEPGRLYLLGPGTTTGRINEALGLEATMLGVDAVRDRALVGADLDEHAILRLLEPGAPASLILGVIGSQGFLLGRGNQQLSPEVVRRVGVENLVVIAGAEKVLGLQPPALRVDLGDGESALVLPGYLRVQMSRDHAIMLRVLR
jgi:predicted polyphosphate/ATP-dependent NAD kinase